MMAIKPAITQASELRWHSTALLTCDHLPVRHFAGHGCSLQGSSVSGLLDPVQWLSSTITTFSSPGAICWTHRTGRRLTPPPHFTEHRPNPLISHLENIAILGLSGLAYITFLVTDHLRCQWKVSSYRWSVLARDIKENHRKVYRKTPRHSRGNDGVDFFLNTNFF